MNGIAKELDRDRPVDGSIRVHYEAVIREKWKAHAARTKSFEELLRSIDRRDGPIEGLQTRTAQRARFEDLKNELRNENIKVSSA